MDSAGKTDLRFISTDDIKLWMNNALESGKMTRRSFKRNNLVAIKTIFARAVEEEVLLSDPAHRVKLRVSKHETGRDMRGFFDDEMNTILAATLAKPSKRMAAYNAVARRWVPWLCAYTGARVNEITQLRASHVKRLENFWCIKITPEAGTQKTLSVRWVPLHEHLIEQGFLKFALAKKGDTPLFTPSVSEPREDRTMSLSERVGAHLAKWVRGLGIDDPEVAPNHGWRHRWKTEARDLIPKDCRDAIQGHAPATQADEYGDFPPRLLGPLIAKLPRIVLSMDAAEAA
jgi:integrase